jgi:ElaB/YqjD/DUF883 family membrane-anchored ribosome-binding protein
MSEVATNRTGDFSDSLPDSAEELEVVVLAERQKLKRSLDELSSTVRDRLDVRTRLREHPMMTVGAAAALGVVLGVLSNRSAPRRSRVSEPSDHEPSKLRSAARSQSGQVIGNMALTVSTLVGQRLADLVTDGVRKTLAPRSSDS